MAARRRAASIYRVLDFGAFGQAVAGTFSEEALEALRDNPGVRYVEPDSLMYAIDQTVPWGIDRVDADVLPAYDETGTGADIAIIDTGIDDDHPDLQANVGAGKAFIECGQRASGGPPCSTDNCNEPWSDDHNHGTHCAGIAAAVDNTEGVVGVATEATLHAVKVLDCNGSGSFSDVAAGIEYVADQGWDVGSLSLGGSASSAVEDACRYAYDKGVLLVAAAGNDGPCSDCVNYPAAYRTVVAISSIDSDDNLSEFSSTGPEIELTAPGGEIYSTVIGGYDTFSGTSMACPHVAGAAGHLMAGEFPNAENITFDSDGTLTQSSYEDPGGARGQLRRTAEDIGLSSNDQGYGLLDAENAVPFLEQWRFAADSRFQYSSPAVSASRVFVGGLNETLYAVNRDDGSIDWQFDRAGSLADSSPTLANGRVFVGSGGGTVYAIDASTGAIDWTYSTDSAIVSSPTVADGIVYVETNAGDIVALDDGAAGSEQWTRTVGEAVYSRPAVDGSSVVVTTNAGAVVTLDAGDGSERWRIETDTEVGHTSPAIANDDVFVAADAVYALDLADGSVNWQTSYGGTVGSSPVYDGGLVIVGSADGTVYALDAADGAITWTQALGGPVGSTPTIVDDRVVVGSDNSGLALLNVDTGTRLAHADVEQIRTAPAIDSDGVYISTWSGKLVSLENVTG